MPNIDQKRMLGKLFKDIPTDTYNKVFRLLRHERILHPSNRDDEILMLILCQVVELGIDHKLLGGNSRL